MIVHGVLIDDAGVAALVLEALAELQRRRYVADARLVTLATELAAVAELRSTSVTTPARWLSIEGYAEAAHVSERTARRRCQSGTVPAEKVRGTWRVRIS